MPNTLVIRPEMAERHETVAGADSKAFARWLHHRYARWNAASAYRFTARYHVKQDNRRQQTSPRRATHHE